MEWNPNGYLSDVLINNNVKDENVIKQFVHFHNLPLIVNDICLFAKNNFNKYPSKITNKGMEFSAFSDSKIELEFTETGKIHIYKFMLKVVRCPKIDIQYILVAASPFTYKSFRELLGFDNYILIEEKFG